MAYIPIIGLKKKPNFHEDGVSFIIPVKDEEKWIEASILSIQEIADEIIVVDSSVEDSTTEIVNSLSKSNSKIKHIRFYCNGPHAFALSCHIGLVNVTYRWVFKWDSDFIAKSSEALEEWKRRLNQLNNDSYYVIDLPRINLEGDLLHQPKHCPFGVFETRIFTWSPELRWALKTNYWEQVTGDSVWGHRFPPWYKILRWNEPYIFHCNIKSPRRMLLRKFWMDYMANKESRFHSLESYVEYRVTREWNMSLHEAEQFVQEELMKNLIPYDECTFGELPKILQIKRDIMETRSKRNKFIEILPIDSKDSPQEFVSA
jgi:glycosyltransferase involved in cell wall biosynthesis